MALSSLLFSVLSCALLFSHASAWMRWVFPTPRTTNSELRVGPCGDAQDETPIITEFSPGWTTLAFKEDFTAANVVDGGSFRIALLGIGPDSNHDEDNASGCLLLDHIPSSDSNEARNYTINVNFPNVDCEKCVLQLLNVVPRAAQPICNYDDDRFAKGGTKIAGDCIDAYYSCANVRITGNTPKKEELCDAERVQLDWPFQFPERTLCIDTTPGTGQCEPILRPPLFRYPKEEGDWDPNPENPDYEFLDDRQRGGDNQNRNVPDFYRTQQFRGFANGDVSTIEGATELEETPVNSNAAALTMAGIFGVAFAFVLFIHFQTHGVSCNWLNEGGLPTQRVAYSKVPGKDPAIVKTMMTNPIASGNGPPPPPVRPPSHI